MRRRASVVLTLGAFVLTLATGDLAPGGYSPTQQLYADSVIGADTVNRQAALPPTAPSVQSLASDQRYRLAKSWPPVDPAARPASEPPLGVPAPRRLPVHASDETLGPTGLMAFSARAPPTT